MRLAEICSVCHSMFRTFSLGVLAVLFATSLACSGERKKLQQPVVPASKLECHLAHCLSLSTTVLVSDACFRTCTAHCGGQFGICIGGGWLNDCRPQGDRCDLSCLKHCRAYGGPLLDLTD
jgi:hypothetical protein